jgi:heat-inducible transcriptional repressor
LRARTEQILCSIVQSYIETGEPVASLEISRLRRYQLSAASIRNVMAELAAEGYLHQPHASAGRVPTGKAFEIFVNNLPGRRLQSDELARIRQRLHHAESLDQRVEQCSQMLTEMTQGVALTAAIPTAAQTLEQVELVALGGQRVLMVVVTGDKVVRDQVVTLDQPVTTADLAPIRNYINTEFSGWLIGDIQPEIARRLAQTSAQYHLILQKLMLLYERGILGRGLAAEVHMDGASKPGVVRAPAHARKTEGTVSHARREEENSAVARTIPGGEIRRSRCAHRARSRTSHDGRAIVDRRFDLAAGRHGRKDRRHGPLRMDYSRAMSAVLHVGRALGSLPS